MKIDRSSDLIVVGGRQMKLSRGQVEFAKSAPWHLHEGPVSIGYRNFKLYLDERKGLKKVWYLSVKKGEIVESADLKKLREFNPDMEPWVLDALNGNVRQAPTPNHDPANRHVEKAVRVKRKAKVVPPDPFGPVPSEPMDEAQGRAVLRVLGDAWQEGRPLSVSPVSKAHRRFAVDVLARSVGVHPALVKGFLDQAMRDGVIANEIADKRTKMRGIRVCASY